MQQPRVPLPFADMIKSIQVINVRGIENTTFAFSQPDMHPNKVHLLIASNGFGKSSIATAFDSLNSRRLSLKEKDYYRHEETRLPELILVAQGAAGDVTLKATSVSNEIGREYDTFVVKGPRKVKATQRPTESGFQVPVGELVIEPIELCKIPEKTLIPYKYRESAACLGGSSKAAPNIAEDLTNGLIINAFLDSKFSARELGVKLKRSYDSLLAKIASMHGIKDEVIARIHASVLDDANAIPEITLLGDALSHYNCRAERLLATIQLITACRHDLQVTKSAKKWHEYEPKYLATKALLQSCNPNPDWIKIELKKTQQTLIVSLPKPDTMSNGQRDFLCFLTQLLEFEFKATKKQTILIIDDVFDYLDYANVIVCQYFLKKFIDLHVNLGRHIYCLVLTHLDPSVFNSFVFSKKLQKNHHLDRRPDAGCSTALSKIIRMRGEDPDLERVFAKHHAHHCLEECDEKEMFRQKALKTNWGCSATFKAYCQTQLQQYLSDGNHEVDYLAVCLALRTHIEKCACNQLDVPFRQSFTDTRRTTAKLDYAVERGSSVPEIHFLLAGLYNSALHTNSIEEDFLTPVTSKLQNACIREMVREAVN